MHPNKYKQNENIRPESLLKTITSVTPMLLMVLGIVGIALKFFYGNGLFGQAFSYLFQSIQSMLLIPLILFALWLLNRWISTPSKTKKKELQPPDVYHGASRHLLCFPANNDWWPLKQIKHNRLI
ncbi:MAG: hypothetical protein OR997_01405 [Methylophilaceae bacterium]|nr:hypothetical protein [Methylophilaceae bacterium]